MLIIVSLTGHYIASKFSHLRAVVSLAFEYLQRVQSPRKRKKTEKKKHTQVLNSPIVHTQKRYKSPIDTDIELKKRLNQNSGKMSSSNKLDRLKQIYADSESS